MTELEGFRTEKDRFFRTHPESPLTPAQQHSFRGLRYFPDNPDLDLNVIVSKFPAQTAVVLPTSTGDTQTYRHYGSFKFMVADQEAQLTIFIGDAGFFMPFVDALAGTETYGAGRYLEPEPLGNDTFRVDFNQAYNPYCAYNDRWSCPITPPENRLRVPIRAGEMIFAT